MCSQPLKHAYDDICGEWNTFRKCRPVNACIAHFCEMLGEGAKVLDIGCGTGYPVAAYLSSLGTDVTGIDVSRGMLDFARALNLPHARFELCDILDFCPSEQFDGAIAFDSLWHIAHDRQRDIYPKISSLLKSGAPLLFTHGNRDGEVTGGMFGKKFYYSALDKDEVLRLLDENGMDVLYLAENYKEETTGLRDLLIVAKKR